MSFKVFFVNLGFGIDQRFQSIPEAVQAGKRAYFEFTVRDDKTGQIQVGWGPISGIRTYTEQAKAAIYGGAA